MEKQCRGSQSKNLWNDIYSWLLTDVSESNKSLAVYQYNEADHLSIGESGESEEIHTWSLKGKRIPLVLYMTIHNSTGPLPLWPVSSSVKNKLYDEMEDLKKGALFIDVVSLTVWTDVALFIDMVSLTV